MYVNYAISAIATRGQHALYLGKPQVALSVFIRDQHMFNFAEARRAMIDSQIRTNDVTDLRVLKAFRSVEREKFVPKARQALAYSDSHVELGEGRYLVRPREFSKMVQAAVIQPTDVVLDIACGRGYSSAILAQLAETVVALEDTEERVNRASAALIESDVSNAAVLQGSLKSGAAEHGPFNVIFVNGAVPSVPKTWLAQLAHGGRLVAVVQDGPVGRACVFTRSGDAVGERIICDAGVPLMEELKPEPAFEF